MATATNRLKSASRNRPSSSRGQSNIGSSPTKRSSGRRTATKTAPRARTKSAAKPTKRRAATGRGRSAARAR